MSQHANFNQLTEIKRALVCSTVTTNPPRNGTVQGTTPHTSKFPERSTAQE